jgi:copper chaperone CopZ
VTRIPVRPFLSLLIAVTVTSLPASAAEGTKTTLTITGMTCGGCATAVKIELKRTDGVTSCVVSYEKGEADVIYDAAKTTPEKIAESISKTGFKASVKGGTKASEASGQGAVAPLELQAMKDWFNGASDSVRIVSLLSPTCGVCQSGHGVVKSVFSATHSRELRGFIGWLPMLAADDAASAATQASSFRDPRLSQAWDGQRTAGALFARMLKLKGTAWDVYLLYPRGVRWEGAAPPEPTFWMHQLKAEDGADQKFCLDPARFRQQTLALLEKRG